MSWALPYVKLLETQDEIQFRPRGNSMEPLIKSGQLVTIQKVTESSVIEVDPGRVVLCRVHGKYFLHLVTHKEVKGDENGIKTRFTIGNNKGHTNGTISGKAIFGIVIKIED